MGSPPACHYRRRLQGIYWGEGLLTGSRPPKVAIKRKNGPESHCWGALLKRQGAFHRALALEGMRWGGREEGTEKTPHWLMGPEKCPPTPLHLSSPHFLSHRFSTSLDGSQIHLQSHN